MKSRRKCTATLHDVDVCADEAVSRNCKRLKWPCDTVWWVKAQHACTYPVVNNWWERGNKATRLRQHKRKSQKQDTSCWIKLVCPVLSGTESKFRVRECLSCCWQVTNSDFCLCLCTNPVVPFAKEEEGRRRRLYLYDSGVTCIVKAVCAVQEKNYTNASLNNSVAIM